MAPNIVHVERELGADPSDFRLWVCLHEETHRVQFTAVPWMRDHLFAEIQKLAETMEPSGLLDEGLGRIAEALKGAKESGASLLDVVSTPEQKELIDRMTGVMSLLEGHADVVMDGVGPSVIPSVAKIRGKFNERRKGVGVLDKVLRRLLGLDAKMAQYRDGAVFVRHRRRRRPAWSSSTPSGSDPSTCRPRPRSRTRRPGCRASWHEPVMSLHPSVAAVRSGVRRVLAELPPDPPQPHTVLVACSGGADSLALLSAAVFEGHKAGVRVIGVTVDHGLQAGSAEHATAVVGQMAAMGADETASAPGDRRGRGPGDRGGRPGGPLRRARADDRALRRGAGAARAHARRPGRDRPARASPGAREAGRWPGCDARSRSTAGRCSTWAATTR